METFIKKIESYGIKSKQIDVIILVGSYATGRNSTDSDLDLILVTKEKQEILSNPKFIYNFGIVLNQQIEYYGACTSLRVWYASGLEVEFGFVDPSWIEKPLDLGTKEVLLPAYRVLVDKESNFEDLNLRD